MWRMTWQELSARLYHVLPRSDQARVLHEHGVKRERPRRRRGVEFARAQHHALVTPRFRDASLISKTRKQLIVLLSLKA